MTLDEDKAEFQRLFTRIYGVDYKFECEPVYFMDEIVTYTYTNQFVNHVWLGWKLRKNYVEKAKENQAS